MNLLQRSPTRAVRLSLCLVALLAVGACADGSSDVASRDVLTASSTPDVPAVTASETPSEALTEGTSGGAGPTRSTESSESSTASASPTTAASREPRLLAYAGGESPGVQVHDPADVRKLDGAPAAFKQFIARTAEELVEKSTCEHAAVGVVVATLRTDGYAVGGVDDCGGYAAMWALVDGQWREIQGTQDSWECRTLQRYHVPSDVAGTSCYDYEAGEARRYSHE